MARNGTAQHRRNAAPGPRATQLLEEARRERNAKVTEATKTFHAELRAAEEKRKRALYLANADLRAHESAIRKADAAGALLPEPVE